MGPVDAAVGSVAHCHIIGAHGLGNGACSSPHTEEPSRHLLAGTNLCRQTLITIKFGQSCSPYLHRHIKGGSLGSGVTIMVDELHTLTTINLCVDPLAVKLREVCYSRSRCDSNVCSRKCSMCFTQLF